MEAFLNSVNSKFRATDLVSFPGFFRDMSRISDMTGSLDDYWIFDSGIEADKHAINRDYWIVMNDLNTAVEHYDKPKKAESHKAE